MAVGPPEVVAQDPRSHTGRFLKPMLTTSYVAKHVADVKKKAASSTNPSAKPAKKVDKKVTKKVTKKVARGR